MTVKGPAWKLKVQVLVPKSRPGPGLERFRTRLNAIWNQAWADREPGLDVFGTRPRVLWTRLGPES
jgi:hypothetical protein